MIYVLIIYKFIIIVMAKNSIQYLCQECGDVHLKWSGQCLSCKEWNTLKEFKEVKISKKTQEKLGHKIRGMSNGEGKKKIMSPIDILAKSKNASGDNKNLRIQTDISELDRVVGGGFFKGSLTLLTGDPGIGKSTLSLQACLAIAEKIPEKKVVIISGEESESQITDRLYRITQTPPKNLFLLSESILETAIASLDIENTGFILFDSVQTLASIEIESMSGSVTQNVAVTERIMLLSKKYNIPTILIGHVTKTGEMAGPQTMAHLVDTMLHIEGESGSDFRILKSRKNRFGDVSEIGVFSMHSSGMKEVKNPSATFLSGRLPNAIGSAIYAGVEGSRPFLIEIQSLTNATAFGYPKRSNSGFDSNRLEILLAVVARYTSAKLENDDVFINIVGGLKIKERSADLAIVASLISSKKKIALPEKTVFFGEIGLSGEIRAVNNISKRLQEAQKLGFSQAVIPTISSQAFTLLTEELLEKNIKVGDNLKLVQVKTVFELEKFIV